MNLKNKKIILILLIFLSTILIFSYIFAAFLTPSVNAVAESASSAKSMVVIEATTGRVLAKKNKDEQLAMASTTKIMTALVTIKNISNLDEVVEISDKAVGIEGTSMYLRKGEKLSIKELLFGLMLPSGNDAAVALAYAVGGTEEKFVKMMNEEARSLGLKNTQFKNPHGLDAKGHYTSANDLALITAEAMKFDAFKEICSTKNVQVTGSKINEPRFLANKNKLLKRMEGCNGVKTGFTDNAGRCFVGSCERNGMTLICVVLNCGPMFEECERFLNSAFEEYKMQEILEPYAQGETVDVLEGDKAFVTTGTKHGFAYPLTDEEYKNIKIEREYINVVAPVVKDQVVGKIKIYLNNNLIFEEEIYTMEDVKSIRYLDKIWEVVDKWNI